MTELMIYWISRLDHVHSLCEVIKIISMMFILVCSGVLAIACVCKNMNAKYNRDDHLDSDYETACNIIACFKKPLVIAATALSCTLAVSTFVPTTAEMAAIKVIPQVATPDNCIALKSMSSSLCDAAAKWMNCISKSK